MKRSEINAAIRQMIEFADAQGFLFPPFAHFSPDKWRSCGSEYDEIRQCGLGWDVTDFGKDDFAAFGLTLFTVRNGRHGEPDAKPYCEKIMLVRENQITPMHFHWQKTEDIINRGGGNLICQVHSSTPDELLSDKPLTVSVDGCRRDLPSGGKIALGPGESITLTPHIYHAFWGEPGGGSVLVGEVSTVNDDVHDNRFLDELPRFPGIEEDEPPIRLLCNEYGDAAS